MLNKSKIKNNNKILKKVIYLQDPIFLMFLLKETFKKVKKILINNNKIMIIIISY